MLREHRTILIHGVTGSGKTEVYIQAIQEVIHFGRQAIVLVPEISLTPQTVERFRSRFGEVAVLHSHLSDAERHWHWQRIAGGQGAGGGRRRKRDFRAHAAFGAHRVGRRARVVVQAGFRPAVSRPGRGLGPGEGRSRCRWCWARRRLRWKAGTRRKPANTFWWKCRGGCSTARCPRWARSILRIDKNRRAVTRGSIGRQLHAAIGQGIGGGRAGDFAVESAGILHAHSMSGMRQRGQVPALRHRADASSHAGNRACAIFAITRSRRRAACPKCEFTGIRYSGLGTQRLEAEVRARFPNVPCLRMDTDTMQGHGSHERALAAFRAGKVKILLGTQMIAKGLDFPNVTLVGVINADTALHLPDFRAAERTFHLVTQVAGRTGRGEKGGRVLVQTFNPDHPAIQAAIRHDYAAFAAGELPMRRMLRYPPFASMIRLVIRGPAEPMAREFANFLAGRLKELLHAEDTGRASGTQFQSNLSELGVPLASPVPESVLTGFASVGECPRVRSRPGPLCPIARHVPFSDSASGFGRRQTPRGRAQVTADLKEPEGVHWIADVDPLDMM